VVKLRFTIMRITVLGSGQDAGIPHTGCYCGVCNRARESPEFRRLGASIAVTDGQGETRCLIDATPDFKQQLDMLREDFCRAGKTGRMPMSGILLTHAHLGHVAGILNLGKEAMDTMEVPVYCTPKMASFLRNNYPFRLLDDRKNITIIEVRHREEFELGGFTCVPVEVPHRNEIADTVGFIIKSKKNVFYLPDIDNWTDEVLGEIKKADYALIDGTFYSKDEMPKYAEVPHPPMTETIGCLESVAPRVCFTHINHTNPVNLSGKERMFVESKGFGIAYDGMSLEI
jgi:pyrroloquinoline quinone biosynthesis protein B